jgi:hypothetical protein
MTAGTGRRQFHSNIGQPSFKMLLRKLEPSSSNHNHSRNYNHNQNHSRNRNRNRNRNHNCNPSKDLISKPK